jgi:hypothetical protein
MIDDRQRIAVALIAEKETAPCSRWSSSHSVRLQQTCVYAMGEPTGSCDGDAQPVGRSQNVTSIGPASFHGMAPSLPEGKCYPCRRSNLLPMSPVCTVAAADFGPAPATITLRSQRAEAGELQTLGASSLATGSMEETWHPSRAITVEYDAAEYDLYRANDPACAFDSVRWPLPRGRGRHGEFPLVVVREHFRTQGYVVLASEPNLPNDDGFIVVSYRGKRQAGDPAYRRMEAIFGAEVLADLNARADIAKLRATRGSGGGDPDLFAFRSNHPEDRFFVEVKHQDQLTSKQLVTFTLIEELCPIVVARLVKRKPSTNRG